MSITPFSMSYFFRKKDQKNRTIAKNAIHISTSSITSISSMSKSFKQSLRYILEHLASCL